MELINHYEEAGAGEPLILPSTEMEKAANIFTSDIVF